MRCSWLLYAAASPFRGSLGQLVYGNYRLSFGFCLEKGGQLCLKIRLIQIFYFDRLLIYFYL